MPTAPKGLYDALLAVQKSAPNIQKDAINPHFGNRYISLDSLMPQILPLLNANGLVLTQTPAFLGEAEPAMTTRITHVSSLDFIESTMPLILDRQNSQGLGSAITYARRYALLAILGLVADTDDDGEAASTRERVTPARRGGGKKPEVVGGGTTADDSEDW